MKYIKITYDEHPESKKWLTENTGKRGQAEFIRSAVKEAIKRATKKK